MVSTYAIDICTIAENSKDPAANVISHAAQRLMRILDQRLVAADRNPSRLQSFPRLRDRLLAFVVKLVILVIVQVFLFELSASEHLAVSLAGPRLPIGKSLVNR